MTVGIAGLGLIGGSFAKAWHEAGHRVLACNRTRAVLERIAYQVKAALWDIEPAAGGWKAAQRAINEWIMTQPYAVDVSTPLTDENGETNQFEYLTTVDHEGKLYVVLMLLDEDAEPNDEDEGEVIILEIQKDENGEDIYVSVDDDAVSDAVFQKFLEIVDEQDEEED